MGMLTLIQMYCLYPVLVLSSSKELESSDAVKCFKVCCEVFNFDIITFFTILIFIAI